MMDHSLQVEALLRALEKLPVKYRPKVHNWALIDDWSKGVFAPTEGYLEFERIGPVRLKDVEWIDIDPIEIKRIGRRVPDMQINHTSVLLQVLRNFYLKFEVRASWVRVDIRSLLDEQKLP